MDGAASPVAASPVAASPVAASPVAASPVAALMESGRGIVEIVHLRHMEEIRENKKLARSNVIESRPSMHLSRQRRSCNSHNPLVSKDFSFGQSEQQLFDCPELSAWPEWRKTSVWREWTTTFPKNGQSPTSHDQRESTFDNFPFCQRAQPHSILCRSVFTFPKKGSVPDAIFPGFREGIDRFIIPCVLCL